MSLPFVGGKDDVKDNNAFFGYIFGATDYETQLLVVPQSLKTVTITGSRIIPSGAFYRCGNLASIVLSEGIISVYPGAFYRCGNLTSIVLSEGIISVYPEAFYRCGSLTNVTLPNGFTTINYSAFYDCNRLTSIILPNSFN